MHFNIFGVNFKSDDVKRLAEGGTGLKVFVDCFVTESHVKSTSVKIICDELDDWLEFSGL